MKQTLKTSRSNLRSPKIVNGQGQSQGIFHIASNGETRHSLITFNSTVNGKSEPICSMGPEGDITWHNGSTPNEARNTFVRCFTLSFETMSGIDKGSRRRMVLTTLKSVRAKVKKMPKQDLVKYLDKTVKHLEEAALWDILKD